MNVDLMIPVQDAVFAALSAGMPASLATVRQHVPDDFNGSLVVIGRLDASEDMAKGCQAEIHTVEIATFFHGPARRGVLEIMAKVRELLDQQEMPASGAYISECRWLNSTADLDDDGETYIGLQNFEISVEPEE